MRIPKKHTKRGFQKEPEYSIKKKVGTNKGKAKNPPLPPMHGSGKKKMKKKGSY